jgi:hypothetical protein
MSWEPILEGDDAARARAVIARVADAVAAAELPGASLGVGWAGAALLFAQLAHDGDEVAEQRLHDALARALEGVGDLPWPWLAEGFLGVGWVIAHVADRIALDDEVLATFDQIAEQRLADPTVHAYELFEGLAGVAAYARERGRADLLARAIDRITAANVRDGDLGMAHGASGAIAIAAGALADGTITDAAAVRGWLADQVAWLASHARDGTAPCFPMYADRAPPGRTRNGWCYGDLSIATALVAAGRAAGEDAWLDRARSVARAMAAAPIDDVPDVDLTLCHGIAGRAHLFGRLAHALDDAALRAAARRYHVETLARAEAHADLPQGLLLGWSGLALSLHAAVSAVEPRWDRALLMALPARPPAVGH